ncbi:hypothetical protein DTO271D3_2405 [Paecilomyces variotii]|nr:hypothetical protein DTO271D3_2405 [Paecilomyces variotii]
MRYLTQSRYLFGINVKRQRELDVAAPRNLRFYLKLGRSASTLSPSENDDHFFSYTSGRWLYEEETQLRRRCIKFDLEGLRKTAALTLGSRCVHISKLPEGLYNKVFSLTMEDGKEILARIPNPNAGDPDYVVENEVATLDFLRKVIGVPVPKLLGWSARSGESNSVGAAYILMERVKGHQLSDVWETMSESQRFGLVKSLVEIERRLASIRFTNYGSLYYDGTRSKSLNVVDSVEQSVDVPDTMSKFVIGPTTERSFWVDERGELDIDRGPWTSFEEYISAVVRREMSLIRKLSSQRQSRHPGFLGSAGTSPEDHIRLLQQFLAVLPHILPPAEITRPVLLHQDLHGDNIFVHEDDPTRISSIIDWQATYAAPLFLQAKFASIIDCDDPYPWGAVQPELPQDFDYLPESEKVLAKAAFHRLRLKKFYELASRKFNPTPIRAMDAIRDDGDPTNFIFHLIGQTATDGPIPLKELLIQIFEKWDQITEKSGSKVACPISFTQEEISNARDQAQAWADAFNEFEALRSDIAGKDGWVSHEEYEEAMARFEAHRGALETLQRRLEELS